MIEEVKKEEIDRRDLFSSIARENNWNVDLLPAIPTIPTITTVGQRFLTGAAAPINALQTTQFNQFQKNNQVNQNANLFTNNAPVIPLNLMFSASGFDLVGALVKLATRENPKIELGPIDLTCSFLVSDVRLPDMPIVYCSPTFEELTGYPNEEILGKNCRFLQNPSGEQIAGQTRSYTDHSIVQRMKKCVLELDEGQFTLVNYKKNGEVTYY
jgi:PAS domain-containing protein